MRKAYRSQLNICNLIAIFEIDSAFKQYVRRAKEIYSLLIEA